MPLHVLIRGRVQGVGFRWFVREEATALGLSGWVKNCPDGSVEVAADGPKGALESFRARLLEGPPHAHVSTLVDGGPVSEALPNPFQIAR